MPLKGESVGFLGILILIHGVLMSYLVIDRLLEVIGQLQTVMVWLTLTALCVFEIIASLIFLMIAFGCLSDNYSNRNLLSSLMTWLYVLQIVSMVFTTLDKYVLNIMQ